MEPSKQGNDLLGSHDLFKNDDTFGHTQHKEKSDSSPKSDNLLSDDFEHVEHDFVSGTKSFLDNNDFLTSQKHQQPPSYSSDFEKFESKFHDNVKDTDDLLKGISSSVKDVDDFSSGLFSAMDKKYSDVKNFMDFEKNDVFKPQPPASSVQAPLQPVSKVEMNKNLSNFGIDEDYMNPYSTKNLSETKEKLISSDDFMDPMKSDYDQTPPSSINLLKTEAMIHEEKDHFKEPIKSVPEPMVPFKAPTPEPIVAPRKPPTPEPVKVPTPEPVFKKSPTPEPFIPVKPPTPEPVIKKAPTPEPVIEKPTVKPAAKPVETKSTTVLKSKSDMISAEEMFCRIGLDAWFKPERLHPKVESLIYWRDPKKSGPVFGIGLALLIAMSCFSLISVFAYVSLLVLLATLSFRIYKNILQAVQKTSEGHPFKEYLELDLSLSQDKVQNCVNMCVAHLNAFVAELRRLFLVEDLIDSIKFGLLLWCFTYLGAWFNGMTLVIIAFVALFTLPKVYENNKQSIDTYLDLVRNKIVEITDKVKAAIPIGGGKKVESEKDK